MASAMDKYVVVKRIGVGSYGSAYLIHLKTSKSAQFVLKKIRLDNVSPKERAAAQQEVKLLAGMSHPFVLGYVDSFMHKNHLCIITDYCDAGDLYQRLKVQKGYLKEEQIKEWFVQIAMAMAYVHERKVLHRDLKTQNVFLVKDGAVRLGDFGIARTLSTPTEMAQTVIGTPYYMSPEIMESRPYDYKSDIWSLGCVLYELTSLKHAFDAQDMNGLIMKIIRGKVLPVPSNFSPDLRSLINRLLTKAPAQRPSLAEVLTDTVARMKAYEQTWAASKDDRARGGPGYGQAPPAVPRPAPGVALAAAEEARAAARARLDMELAKEKAQRELVERRMQERKAAALAAQQQQRGRPPRPDPRAAAAAAAARVSPLRQRDRDPSPPPMAGPAAGRRKVVASAAPSAPPPPEPARGGPAEARGAAPGPSGGGLPPAHARQRSREEVPVRLDAAIEANEERLLKIQAELEDLRMRRAAAEAMAAAVAAGEARGPSNGGLLPAPAAGRRAAEGEDGGLAAQLPPSRWAAGGEGPSGNGVKPPAHAHRRSGSEDLGRWEREDRPQEAQPGPRRPPAPAAVPRAASHPSSDDEGALGAGVSDDGARPGENWRERRERLKADENRRREQELLEARKVYFEERKRAADMSRNQYAASSAVSAAVGGYNPSAPGGGGGGGRPPLAPSEYGRGAGAGVRNPSYDDLYPSSSDDEDEDDAELRQLSRLHATITSRIDEIQGARANLMDPEEADQAAARRELERELDGDVSPTGSPPHGGHGGANAANGGGGRDGRDGAGHGGAGPMLSTQAFREGRLSDRIAALRDLCERNLGPVLFEKLHKYMAERARMVALADEPSDEAAFRAALREQLGEGRAAFVALIDQLIFYQEMNGGA